MLSRERPSHFRNSSTILDKARNLKRNCEGYDVFRNRAIPVTSGMNRMSNRHNSFLLPSAASQTVVLSRQIGVLHVSDCVGCLIEGYAKRFVASSGFS